MKEFESPNDQTPGGGEYHVGHVDVREDEVDRVLKVIDGGKRKGATMNKGKHPSTSPRHERVASRLLTVGQMADYLGVGRTQLCRTAIRLEIPYIQLTPGGNEYYDRADIDRWIDGKKQGGIQHQA